MDFVKGFDSFTISYYHDGWNSSFVEVLNDNLVAAQRSFLVTIKRAQEVYVGMEFYDSRMYPNNCKPVQT